MRVFTVDPGVEGTGIAMWEDFARAVRSENFGLYNVSVLIPPKKYEWELRLQIVVEAFNASLDSHQPEKCCFEYPAYFESKSGAAASGNLVKLAVLTGALAGVCIPRGIEVEFVPVNTWKGQCKKEVIQKRVKRILGVTYPNHVVDAVGIGLFLKGLL